MDQQQYIICPCENLQVVDLKSYSATNSLTTCLAFSLHTYLGIHQSSEYPKDRSQGQILIKVGEKSIVTINIVVKQYSLPSSNR